MPVPTDTLRNIRKVSILFAISSVALLASVVWMIKVDYARPWRAIQDDYTDLQVSLAHFDVLANQTNERMEELAQAQAAVQQAQKALEQQQARARDWAVGLGSEDPAVRAAAVKGVLEDIRGPSRPVYAARARFLSEDFGKLIAVQVESPDAEAITARAAEDVEFRGQLVALIEWFSMDKLRQEADAIRGEHARADLEHKAVKGDLTVSLAAYEHAKGLHGEGHTRTQEALAHLNRLREAYNQARLRIEGLEDQRKAIEDQQKLLQAALTAAERALARIEKDRTDAETRYAELSDTIRRGIFNMPMMDFAAPKGTRGRQEIKQAVLPDVQVELNFVKGYQVDRCMTCHTAIADKNFTRENLARKLEEAIFSINEQLAREDKPDRARLQPPIVPDREDLEPGQVARGWNTLTAEQQDALFAALVGEVNKYQKLRGLPELKFGQPLLAHPDLDLYVAADSPHPLSRVGCTTCHDGNGEETDFVLAAHTPKSPEERKAWKEKYYVRTAGIMPEQNFETAEHHWTRPMLQPRYSEAGCNKCHSKITDIAVHEGRPAASRITEGQFLFKTLGCINCHLVEELADSRKVGPDLSHIGEKLTRAFAENWIWFPKDYRPSTNMPHYFLQENNDALSETAGGDSDPILRTKAETVAMTEYLYAVSDGYEREAPPEDLWEPLKAEESEATLAAVERGRRLFGDVGCMACHSNLAWQPMDEFGQLGAPLGEQWITRDVALKFESLGRQGLLAKARRLKGRAMAAAREEGRDPAEVELAEDEVKAALAIDLEEGGEGIPLATIQEVFAAAWKDHTYDERKARRELIRKLFPHAARGEGNVSLTPEEEELAFVSDEAWEAMNEYATERFGEMTYNDRVEYAMRNFKNAYDTLFDPLNVKGPVFTRFAPELSSIRTKFADYEHAVNWLYDWVKNPRHYSSYTKMPSLRLKRGEFPVLDETGQPSGEKIEADEALDIAIYLSTLNENEEFAEKASAPLAEQEEQDPAAYAQKRDELLRILLGGLNSSARTESIIQDVGGELSARLVEKLSRSLGEEQARERVAAMEPDQRRWVFLGDKMIGHYGCYSCHQIRGYENAARPGTELTTWGEKQLTQLDFAFFEHAFEHDREHDPLFKHLYPYDPKSPDDRAKLIGAAWSNPAVHVDHALASFAWYKVRNPRMWDRRKLKGPYEKLKMPNFFLDDEQADALVTYLLSRRPGRVGGSLQVNYDGTPAGRIAEGRALARELNCVSCHIIDGNGAVMHQFITRSDGGEVQYDEVNGPPWLRGQGAKVRADWFYGFLNNVQMLRPWLKVRMPSFHLDDDQSTKLVEYFVGLSEQESQWLAQHLAPVNKYIADARKADANVTLAAMDRPPSAAGDDESNADDAQPGAAAGSDWFLQDHLSDVTRALTRYAVDNRLATASSVDPAESSLEDLASTYSLLVEQGAFLRDLYRVRYPFTEAVREYSPTAVADGETLFYELKCMACHVFGDPSVPGANANPTAPNLQLTSDRLQSDWVRRWLQAPHRIQPGTKMPSLFGMGELVGAFKDYPEEDREKISAKLKDPAVLDDPYLQIQALTSFLYYAGDRRLNKVQPPAQGEEQPVESSEEEPAEEAQTDGTASEASEPDAEPAAEPSDEATDEQAEETSEAQDEDAEEAQGDTKPASQ